MRSRASIDPELHVLRSVARSAEGRTRQELESARFGVYAAFESGDGETAKRWCRALRAALVSSDVRADMQAAGAVALDEIECAIDDET